MLEEQLVEFGTDHVPGGVIRTERDEIGIYITISGQGGSANGDGNHKRMRAGEKGG